MPDPELPVVTIDDLGVLRDVRADATGHVVVEITPTYSGCPAMDAIRDDVAGPPAPARPRRRRSAPRARARVDDRLDHRRRSRGPARARHRAAVTLPERWRSPCPSAAPGAARPTPARSAASARRHASRCGYAGPATSPSTTSRRSELTTDTRAAPASRRHSVFHRLRVSVVERLTDDAVAITFEVPPDLRDAYAFAAGQHVNVSMPDGDEVRRSYSICSPAGSGRLRIAVKRLPGGVFSSHAMERLAPGDELDVMTPAGRFTPALDPAHAKHYVAIAAGSGITPVLSIVTTVLDGEPGSRVTLVYGNRTSQSVMFLDELADLKDRHPERLHLVHVLSREDQEAELLSGRIDADRMQRFLDTLIPPDDRRRVVPVRAARARDERARGPGPPGGRPCHRARRAVPRGRPATTSGARRQRLAAPRPARSPWCSTGAGARSRSRDPDESVLEAVLRVRNDAPFACKGGVCGTCRAQAPRRKGRHGRATSRWRTPRWAPAMCSPASRTRPRPRGVARLRRLTRWRDFQRRRRGGRQLWVEQPGRAARGVDGGSPGEQDDAEGSDRQARAAEVE